MFNIIQLNKKKPTHKFVSYPLCISVIFFSNRKKKTLVEISRFVFVKTDEHLEMVIKKNYRKTYINEYKTNSHTTQS